MHYSSLQFIELAIIGIADELPRNSNLNSHFPITMLIDVSIIKAIRELNFPSDGDDNPNCRSISLSEYLNINGEEVYNIFIEDSMFDIKRKLSMSGAFHSASREDVDRFHRHHTDYESAERQGYPDGYSLVRDSILDNPMGNPISITDGP